MSALAVKRRGVPAGHGWDWIVAGWQLFRRQPLLWMAAVILYFLILVALALVPVLGSLATMVLAPVLAGGLVSASRKLDRGGAVELTDFFAGFRERFPRLAAVGLLYLGASVLIALVVGLVAGTGIWNLLAGDPQALLAAGATVALAVLVMAALMVPVLMALWFAPPLVTFHELGAVDAMKASFWACLQNLGPFLVYGLVLLLLSVLASMPLLLGWLVLGPVMAASIYAAYRDVFVEQPAAAP